MNRLLLQKIFFPGYHKVIRSGVLENLRRLRETQWFSKQDLKKLQQDKLATLLRHAWENVPFYRKQFEEAGISPSDFVRHDILLQLPLLTKKDINQNLKFMISRNRVGGKLIPNSTSGSTGEALRFYTDMRSWAARRAVTIREGEWVGVELGDRQAILWGAPMDLKKAQTIRSKIHRWFNNYILLSSYELSKDSLRRYVRILDQFEPVLLVSYPGPLYELARFVLAENLHFPSIRCIVSSAETLFPWQKETAEKAFRCPVYDRYGCREFGSIAHECETREGLHINAERVIVEVLNEELNPCKPGETGEIVITDLDNYNMPLIRYRIGDIGAFSDHVCSCGRRLPLLQRIEGRTLDVIRTPGGKAIGGTFWTILFRSIPGIEAFQVVQEHLDEIEVRFVKDSNFEDSCIAYFRDKIAKQCGQDLRVSFNEVKKIEKTPSGKARFIISRI